MKKLIFISLFIFLAICSKSWTENSNLIPDGKWYGNLQVRGGSVICNFTIDKIFIKNNDVNIYGDHILGNDNFSFKFNFVTDKWARTLFKINNLEFLYDFSFIDESKLIKIAFNDRCTAEGFFVLNNS